MWWTLSLHAICTATRCIARPGACSLDLVSKEQGRQITAVFARCAIPAGRTEETTLTCAVTAVWGSRQVSAGWVWSAWWRRARIKVYSFNNNKMKQTDEFELANGEFFFIDSRMIQVHQWSSSHARPAQTVSLKDVQFFEMIMPGPHVDLHATQFLPVGLKKPLWHVQLLPKEGAGRSVQSEFDPQGDVAQASKSMQEHNKTKP